METAPRVMASHLLSEVEPIKGTTDVLADLDAQQQLDRLVEYLMDPEPTAPFALSGGMANHTSTNTVPDADSDNEWQNDD
ncbi:hypothetical protein [Streptomyces sp. NPDC047315]|uniref:hypothetical protein n=1 Tax=Streptomyces sp. NPDC047315 TaxID=3155142 RepID=UPI0033EA6FEC